MKPVESRGHHITVRGRKIYEGRVTIFTDNVPEVVIIDGHRYRLDDERPDGYVSPEMHMHMETR